MAWKTGDTISLPIVLTVLTTGAGLSYANVAAAQADGWQFLFRNAAVALASPPTVALTPDPSALLTGLHYLTFILPAGVDTLAVVVPATYYTPGNPILLVTPNNDEDSLSAQLSTAAASPTAASRVNQYDWQIIDGDNFSKAMAVALTALADFGYSDLTLSGWTASGAVRLTTDGTTDAPAAVLDCAITTPGASPAPIITASWGTFPAGLALSAAEIVAGTKAFRYDIQVKRTLTFAITGVSTVSKTFTMSGDQRQWFDAGGTFSITGSTGNDASYTIATGGVSYTGGNTILTVTTTPASAVADGTINDVFTLTVIRGTLTVLAQVDRT